MVKRSLKDSDPNLRMVARQYVSTAADLIQELEHTLENGSVQEQQQAIDCLHKLPSSDADRMVLKCLDMLESGKASFVLAHDILTAASRSENPRIAQQLLRIKTRVSEPHALAEYFECLFGGDRNAGRKLFFERGELGCSRCHRVGGEGGTIGPDLGAIGAQRDRLHLLESVIHPDKEVTEGFASITVHTHAGASVAGLLVSEDSTHVQLRTPDGNQIKVARNDVAAMTRGASVMPKDVAKVLTKGEIRNLIEFLAAQRSGAAEPSWPQWRGSLRDGIANGARLPREWPNKSPAPVWRAAVGEGYSSPVLVGDRLFLMSRENEQEHCICLDALSGRELWRTSYSQPYEPFPGARDAGRGPKSTPTVHGENVCTLGIDGRFRCLDVQSGRVRWQRDFAADYWGVEKDEEGYDRWKPLCGAAASPLVDGSRVIVPVGGPRGGAMAAFDTTTGKLSWKSLDDRASYASPISAEIAGVRQIIGFTGKRMAGFDPDNGNLLWDYPYEIPFDDTIVTAIVWNNLVLVCGDDNPATALRIERRDGAFHPSVAWQNKNLRCSVSSPVLRDGYLYGFSNSGRVSCVEMNSGQTMWTSGPVNGSYASLVVADNQLLVLSDSAQLTSFELNPRSCAIRGRVTLDTEGSTWAHLAVVGTKLFLRDQRHVICYDLSIPAF
jgi:putative heme-binding domain-containing protein